MLFNNPNTEKRLKAALIAFIACQLLVLCLYQLKYTLTAGLSYDDGYNASVAKNIAFGYGNATSYHKLILNNPEVTTGPAILLPLAGMIFLFGNQYWMPSFVFSLISFALLILFLYRSLKQSHFQLGALASFALFLPIFIFGSTETSGSGEQTPIRIWVQLLGEIPSILLFLLGCLYLTSDDKKSLSLTGILWGLALHSKVTIFIPMSGTLFYLFLVYSENLRDQKFKAIRNFIKQYRYLFFGIAIVKIVFSICFLILPKKEAQALGFKHFLDFAKWAGSGVDQIENSKGPIALIFENLVRNFAILGNYFSNKIFLVLFLVSVLAFLINIVKNSRIEKKFHVEFMLFAAGITHLVWWISLSNTGWIRHLYPGLFILMLSMIMISFQTRKLWMKSLLILFFALGIWKTDIFLKQSNWNLAKSPRLIASLKVADYLHELKKSSSQVALLGCGWWAHRDLEYLMPESLNFSDCEVEKPFILNPEKDFILVRSDYWNWGNDMGIEKVTQFCERNLIFQESPFFISKCIGEP